jgi:CheY-like chemotaxis protein
MEAVGVLAGGIAHDFNNILQAILGYTQILLINKPENDPDISKLREIEKSAKRASELIQQLLTFSRKVETKPRPIDLNKQVRDVEKLLERVIPRMIQIELILAEDLKPINAEPAQIEQIIMNLAVNARDAMPDGGKLIIETSNVVLDEDYCRTHAGAKPGEYVMLSISDTGSGMEKDILEHIFEPFYTTKDTGKGTGLGLAMVYGIVKSHNGYIMCYSEPGRGTTFKIYFPAITDEYIEQEPLIFPEDLFWGTETILLVDDEESIRNLGKQMLERFGYKVLLASNGEEAIEIYRTRMDQISLIILDLIMPGMSGDRCLKELLKINPQIKVIISSGYSPNHSVSKDIEKEAKGFINKPYDLKNLLSAVKEALSR